MNVRRANISDMHQILAIYDRARAYMKTNSNPSQWGDVYPPQELVERDILEGNLYVIEQKNSFSEPQKLLGVFVFLPDGDPIYNNIVGKWLNDLPHAAIHRVASSGEGKGILSCAVNFCLSVSKNLKIDTHPDNIPMQNALLKLGFVNCGRILLESGELHLTFQRCDA